MADVRVGPRLAQLPNALTLARFAMIPPFVVLAVRADDGYSITAAVLFGLAGVTDQIDGYLARRWRVESEFGKYADPLADRLMIDAAIILLFLAGRLPWVGLALVLVRDAILVGGSRFAVKRGYSFEVSLLGKTATWVLYASVVAVLTTHSGETYPMVLFWVGVGMALAAGGDYLVRVLRTEVGRGRAA